MQLPFIVILRRRRVWHDTERILNTSLVCITCGVWRCPQCFNLIGKPSDHRASCARRANSAGQAWR